MSDWTPDTENELFTLASRLVNESARNIFLTGRAGTGKTTFLKQIRQSCPKQLAVLAPTGVAAINAGGVTIHSFFQLPLAPFIPQPVQGLPQNGTSRQELLKSLRLNSEKIRVIRQLELLIIDEISMVRCDTLDAIDAVLRHVRKRPSELFGGVQLLMIGDLMQLPPVIRDEEWTLLSGYYQGPYFFHSHALSGEMPLHVEFSKIYRQADHQFISLLNQVRNNQLDAVGLSLLESRYDPDFKRTAGDGYIILTTHNERARQINQRELAALPGQSSIYEAKIKDDFPERSFPAEQSLELRPGAQVMFIRNDSAEKGKRYFNGRIGTVTRLEEESIFVNCGEPKDIEVKPEVWENIRYTLHPGNRQLEQNVLGSFIQFPLRLAWAITIHKSQGLTFEKAIIDAGAAFAPGQVYVALSRCTSLEGLVLQTRINTYSLAGDPRLAAFTENQVTADRLEEEFLLATRQYHFRLLAECFEPAPSLVTMEKLMVEMKAHQQSLNPPALSWYEGLSEKMKNLSAVARKFCTTLKPLMENKDDGDQGQLTERLAAARTYFLRELADLQKMVEFCPVRSDSYQQAREMSEDLRDLFVQVTRQRHVLDRADLLQIGSIQENRKNFKPPEWRPAIYAAQAEVSEQVEHPELFQVLKSIRDGICRSSGLPVYLVANTQSLREMTRFLPQNPRELEQVKGFGPVKLQKYGKLFLDPIIQYAESKGLRSLMHEKDKSPGRLLDKPRDPRKPDTRKESLLMFRQGKTIAEISALRKLKPATIESHLTFCIAAGELPVEEVLESQKIALIEAVLMENRPMGEIKARLGEAATYSEIRMVMAGRRFRTESSDQEATAR